MISGSDDANSSESPFEGRWDVVGETGLSESSAVEDTFNARLCFMTPRRMYHERYEEEGQLIQSMLYSAR
jgi:hypothetical protein